MCDSAEGNWVWTVQDQRTGKPVETQDGYVYYFADEEAARDLVDRLGRPDLELRQVREPGA